MSSISEGNTVKMPIWAKIRITNNYADDIEKQELISNIEQYTENNLKQIFEGCSTYCQTGACQVHCGGSSQIPF